MKTKVAHYLEINRVTLKDVEAFMDSKKLQYRQTVRGRLSTLFNFAVRRGYRSDNPCDRLESVKVVQMPPSVFTVEQVKVAVEWLNKNARNALPWYALSTFCGLRPEESEQTTKADIHFAEGFIRVEAQTSKIRQRRVVYPRPEAMAFLKHALKRGTLPLSGGERRWMLSGRPGRSKGLRDALGFKVWPKDITRHTAASYWLASEGETVKHVAKMLGHSESVCESRYKAVKTQKEASEFWGKVETLTSPS
jgi:integrase